MTFLGWYSLVMMCVSALLTISLVGKSRKTLEGGEAMLTVLLTAPIIIYVAMTLFR